MSTLAAHLPIAGKSEANGLSFWQPGGYKPTLTRISDSAHLCQDFISMIQERATIEEKYASLLRKFSEKWNHLIDKGSEYGTMQSCWKSVLIAADRIASRHIQVKEALHLEVIKEIKHWQKQNLARHSITHNLKFKKQMEEDFKRAQKPWEKIYKNVNECKAEYHGWCAKERTCLVRERNASKDSSVSVDQRRRFEEETQRAVESKLRARMTYEAAIRELHESTPKYMEDMKYVFKKCQDKELLRMEFFKERFLATQRILNLSKDPDVDAAYSEFAFQIQKGDSAVDLKWWDNNRGPKTSMDWPTQLEEYREDARENITNKSFITSLLQNKSDRDGGELAKNAIATGPIALTSYVEHDELPEAGEPALVTSPSDISNDASDAELAATPLPQFSENEQIDEPTHSDYYHHQQQQQQHDPSPKSGFKAVLKEMNGKLSKVAPRSRSKTRRQEHQQQPDSSISTKTSAILASSHADSTPPTATHTRGVAPPTHPTQASPHKKTQTKHLLGSPQNPLSESQKFQTQAWHTQTDINLQRRALKKPEMPTTGVRIYGAYGDKNQRNSLSPSSLNDSQKSSDIEPISSPNVVEHHFSSASTATVRQLGVKHAHAAHVENGDAYYKPTTYSPQDMLWDSDSVDSAVDVFQNVFRANDVLCLVKAMYNYAPEEADEVSLRKGEVLAKLQNTDSQGWCKGRKLDGSEGLFPAQFVVEMRHPSLS